MNIEKNKDRNSDDMNRSDEKSENEFEINDLSSNIRSPFRKKRRVKKFFFEELILIFSFQQSFLLIQIQYFLYLMHLKKMKKK